MSIDQSEEPARLSRRDVVRIVGAGAATLMFGGAIARAQQAAAPTTGPAGLQGGGFYRVTLGGGVTATMVSDGGFAMVPRQMFPNATEADIVAAAKVAHVSPDNYPGQVNCVVIERGNIRVLVDTGCGKLFGPTTGFLVPNLRRAGIEPESITHVALTHAHPDHVGGLLDGAGKPTFAKAKVFVSKAEHDFWSGDVTYSKDVPAAMVGMMTDAARGAFAGVKDNLELFAPGDRVAEVLGSIGAPGHTPGHVAFFAGEVASPGLMLLGDSIHIFPLQMAHPNWHITFDRDGAQAEQSRRMLLARAAESGAVTTAAHAPFPPAGYVDRDGDAFRWTARPWEW